MLVETYVHNFEASHIQDADEVTMPLIVTWANNLVTPHPRTDTIATSTDGDVAL